MILNTCIEMASDPMLAPVFGLTALLLMVVGCALGVTWGNPRQGDSQ